MILAVKNHWFESVTYASVLCIALHINLRIALQFLLQEQQTLPYYVAYGYDNDIHDAPHEVSFMKFNELNKGNVGT